MLMPGGEDSDSEEWGRAFSVERRIGSKYTAFLTSPNEEWEVGFNVSCGHHQSGNHQVGS